MMLLEIVHVLDPGILQRARRVEVAVRMLEDGKTPASVRAAMRSRFGMLQPAAWRLVDIAADLAVTGGQQNRPDNGDDTER